jgi:ATP-dependent 26S proteasome regulatory subunit
MLIHLDRFRGVVVFATNLASNYDPAFVRRILGHIEMPLPDATARAQLWRQHIPKRMPIAISDSDWATLVRKTKGLAGGDILNAVVNAASHAVERQGADCVVTMTDFIAAIETGKQAKAAVGVK